MIDDDPSLPKSFFMPCSKQHHEKAHAPRKSGITIHKLSKIAASFIDHPKSRR